MAENKEYVTDAVENGTVNVSEEVVAAIAAASIKDIDGVFGLSSSFTADLAQILGTKNQSKGVHLTFGDHTVAIECYVVIVYGYEIPAVAAKIQAEVKNAVEAMTGLSVVRVDVDICGISAPKEKKNA